MVVNELISITYYFGKVRWSFKSLICNSFLFGEGVEVMKQLIFNSFSFWGRVWKS